ncbi:MAG: DUF5989 family protein [Bdellovibrionota bacterium]|jgi:hypothetical protein|nr:DUF5989 family protein [Bdellovibrionota bacterium]
MDFIKDCWGFLKTRKKYWLLPLLLFLFIMGGLLFFTSSTAVAPFIYTTF